MKNALIVVLIVKFLFVFPGISRADSPITTTDFYRAYLDVQIVQRAHLEGVMGLEIAEYLSSPENPIDVKAAAINALSWRFEGKNNAELYMYYLGLLYHVSILELDTDFLSADEIFCLGYLMVMDNYFDPAHALPLLEVAQKAMKDSFTVSIILALTKAQIILTEDWCAVWKLTEKVLENRALNLDLRPEAIKIIVDYMILYKDYCD
ncbi:MAG: hypothetical protein HRU72_08615 [Planctomycetia bacterium]|nr:hypothetical protein [Candidatus Brocadia sp.]MDG6006640.1 hypothetical protein [Candidatus Brocadia sp.]QOJ06602.1 MAG: hypothetical protein HRU72_08615 [Planctomycetia bacterium]TVL94703.1 MAG: hypothetical protein CV082_13865 [Candidatus Brocadia sp. BL1]HQU32455.1 hypothetical protein [Candidatus Brocadia sapporoensis]